MSIGEFLAMLEQSSLADAIRNSIPAFPLIEAAHVTGAALVFGMALILDLRLLGLTWSRRPFTVVADDVLKWAWAAFAIAVTSGALMFITNAAAYYVNFYFRAKMVALALAGLNMLIFEVTARRTVTSWDREPSAPATGKAVAIASLAIWITVIFLGRWVAFAPAQAVAPPGETIDFEALEELVK